MPKPKKSYEKKLYIDMDFAEALERFGTTEAKELPDNIRLSQKRKTGTESTNARPPKKRVLPERND